MEQSTKPITLVEFLRARLDEDEQAARTCEPYVDFSIGEDPTRPEHYDLEAYKAGSLGDFTSLTGVGGILGPYAQHIARHDPARVLREVEAKRRILDDFTHWQPHDPGFDALEPVITTHASVYADHPDYRQEWRP